MNLMAVQIQIHQSSSQGPDTPALSISSWDWDNILKDMNKHLNKDSRYMTWLSDKERKCCFVGKKYLIYCTPDIFSTKIPTALMSQDVITKFTGLQKSPVRERPQTQKDIHDTYRSSIFCFPLDIGGFPAKFSSGSSLILMFSKTVLFDLFKQNQRKNESQSPCPFTGA